MPASLQESVIALIQTNADSTAAPKALSHWHRGTAVMCLHKKHIPSSVVHCGNLKGLFAD